MTEQELKAQMDEIEADAAALHRKMSRLGRDALAYAGEAGIGAYEAAAAIAAHGVAMDASGELALSLRTLHDEMQKLARNKFGK